MCTPDFFGYNAELKLQYRGRLEESGMHPVPDARRDLFEAMVQVARLVKALWSKLLAWAVRSSGEAPEVKFHRRLRMKRSSFILLSLLWLPLACSW